MHDSLTQNRTAALVSPGLLASLFWELGICGLLHPESLASCFHLSLAKGRHQQETKGKIRHLFTQRLSSSATVHSPRSSVASTQRTIVLLGWSSPIARVETLCSPLPPLSHLFRTQNGNMSPESFTISCGFQITLPKPW